MKSKEESSFLQGVESRLDSLFADDPFLSKEKDSGSPQPAVQKVVVNAPADAKEGFQELQAVKEAIPQSEVVSESKPAQDKSEFISEIEKRFSAIFGEDDKDIGSVKEKKETEDLKKIIAETEQEKGLKTQEAPGDIASPPSSILLSPLKDMKSIILSIEWEINDSILEQLEDEINKLYLLYTGDRVIQGFLRIMRFLGRYIRVRGVRSNQDSINLLLYIYDNLESVMVSDGMTEAKKHVVLLDNIKKYRVWAESTDLESSREAEIPEAVDQDLKAPYMEPWERKSVEDQKEILKPIAELAEMKEVSEQPVAEAVIGKVMEEETLPIAEITASESGPIAEITTEKVVKEEHSPFAGIEMFEEKPVVDAIIGKTVVESEPVMEIRQEEKIEAALRGSDIILKEPLEAFSDIVPEAGKKIKDATAMIKDLPPHEAFAYALEEIKKNFRSEIDALKEEIRILKSARQ